MMLGIFFFAKVFFKDYKVYIFPQNKEKA